MENNKHTEYKTKYTHRYIARIVLEAETPLVVGMGDKNIQTDAVVATDVNGLPYIPGSSIAGVLRHAIGEDSESGNNLFGMGDKKGKNGEIIEEGHGSYLIFSEAKMVGKEGKALDGLQMIDWSDDFYAHFRHLPVRQHVRITEKGVAANTGKFDEQVVFKGTRFCFEMELVSDGSGNLDWNKFKSVLNQMSSPSFRLGGGTRSGFGEMKIVSIKTKDVDLTNDEDLKFYLDKSSNLSVDWEESSNSSDEYKPSSEENGWTTYQLDLVPDDFFLFGSGLSDEDADMTPVKESAIVEWGKNYGPKFEEDCILIPATSVKGALAHRVAYHYNKLTGKFADNNKGTVGENNLAVKVLFGSMSDMKQNKSDLSCGNILIEDFLIKISSVDNLLGNPKRDVRNNPISYKKYNPNFHVFPHVAIDRFTGGAKAGALFREKTVCKQVFEEDKLSFSIFLDEKRAFEYLRILKENERVDTKEPLEDIKKNILTSLSDSLQDICKRLLPLGGGVNRGNGCFSGTLTKNGEIIYEPNED